nr:MAG TPA: tail component [Caudoviricetes sp.]
MADISLQGFDDLEQTLLSLNAKVGSDALRSAANAGATIIKDEVVIRAPEKSGILKEAIYQKHIPEQSTDRRQVYFVSWRKGKKSTTDAFYGDWVERGHWYVPPRPKGVTYKAHRAANRAIFVPAHPFLRPSFEAKKDVAIDAMRSKLAENVQKAIAEMRK